LKQPSAIDSTVKNLSVLLADTANQAMSSSTVFTLTPRQQETYS